MNRIVWLYSRLLRLYPPGFRAEYAEEMTDVFASAVAETDKNGVVWVLLAEARDLPISLIEAHLRERRQLSHAFEGGNLVMETTSAIRVLRWSSRAALGIIAVYLLLVVLPFFAFGLHNQPVNAIRGGLFDPKGYPIYSGDQVFPNLLFILTICVMLFAPVWEMVWGGVLALTLLRNWRQLSSKQRWLGGVGLAGSLGLIAFITSPLGRLIMTWLAD